MQPRGLRPNAGRVGASARRPPPPLFRTADEAPGAVEDSQTARSLPMALDAIGSEPPTLDSLRRTVARIEGRPESGMRLEAPVAPRPAAEPPALPAGVRRRRGEGARLGLGVPAFDGLFPGGGPVLAGLWELRAAETRAAGALTGFLAALLVRLGALRHGPVLWVREEGVRREAGVPAGLGFVHLGLDPARLLVVAVREAAEGLWAMEEGLACPGLAAVVGELHGLPKAFDLTASRRLALRARGSGVPALLAGHALPAAASAAALRLAVAPRLSRPVDGFEGGAGFPAWTVTVEKARDGRPGRADLEWNSDDRCFRALVPLPVALAAHDPDRPAGPPRLGTVLAHPGAVRRAS
jgi:protein ImuA